MQHAYSGLPTVVFGLGATKAGTSWLYRYLEGHPDCSMPIPKELHYFDREEGFFKRDLIAQYSARLAKLNPDAPRAKAFRSYLQLLRDDNPDDSAYGQFVRRTALDKPLFGDITPSYALVSADMLKRMAQIAPVTKFVFLMRDPVERLWSNIRMEAGMRAEAKGGTAQGHASDMAMKFLDGKARSVMIRSDYVGVLSRLAEAVPARDVFVEFYERLFSSEAITRLTTFLGIRDVPAEFETRVHQGQGMDLPSDLYDALRTKLAPQYAGVADRFNDLPDAWQAKMGAA